MADKQLYTDLKSIPKGIADGQIMLADLANFDLAERPEHRSGIISSQVPRE